MINSKKFTSAVSAVVVVAMAAACSSSGKSTSSNTTSNSGSNSTSASSAKPTGAPLTIGLICNCTGVFGTQQVDAANLAKGWAQSVNASGGIDGHPVDLTVMDDQSIPGNASTDATQLVSQKVDVIVDDSVLDVLFAPTLATSGIPVVGGNFSTPPYYTDANFFPSGQTNDSITYSNVAVAKEAGATNIGNLYCAEAAQCQQSVPLIAAAGKQLGVSQVYSASISATAPNYTAQCVAAQQAHVQALFIGDTSPIIAKVGTDCSQQNYNPTYITEGTGFTNSLLSTPGVKDHLWSDYPDLPYWDTSNPGIQAMDKVADKYYPGMRNNPVAWSEYVVQTWTAVLLIEDAFKGSGIGTSGTPSASAMLTGFNSIRNDNLGGLAPTLDFSSSTHKVDCWFVARVQNGTPSLQNNGQTTCQTGSSS